VAGILHLNTKGGCEEQKNRLPVVSQNILDKLKNGQKLTESELGLVSAALNGRVESDHSALFEAIARGSVALSASTDLMTTLDEVFGLVGTATGVDRVYYFENHTDPATGELLSSQRIEWAQDRVEPFIDSPELQNLPMSIFREFFDPLEIGEPLNLIVRLIEDDNLKALLSGQQIKSILVLPIYAEGNFHGFIGFDDCTREKEWTTDEISSLQILASHISHLIEKNEVRNLLAKTYRQARIGTWRMNLETEAVYWSPITREIFELADDEPATREVAFKLFQSENDRNKVLTAFDHSIATGEPYVLELEILTRRGNRKWVRDTGQAEFRNGRAISVHGTVQDIDKQKRAELESEKNKKLLNAITDQARVAILVRKLDGEHLFVNHEWKRIFGYEERDIVGKNLFDLFDKEIAEHIHKTDSLVAEMGEQCLFEEKVYTANGPRYFMVNKFPIRGIAGMEPAVGGIGTDITEIKETEERLQEAEQKLRDVVEHSTNLFYSHGPDHHLVYVSPQSHHYFGVNPIEAKRRWTEFITENPINELGFELTERAIKTGKPQKPYELELRRDDGSIIWVEVNEAPIVKEGKTVLITGSLTDITDRKRVQMEVQNSLREKETLLAEIHHRVKNNLAVVASMMQMQAHITDDEKLTDSLLESVLRIKSMANIHEQLYKSQHFAELDFSENLEDLISSVINTMQFSTEISVEYNSDKVHLSVSQAIPCSLIVNEVVTNIIKHAYDGRERGAVNVELRKRESEKITLLIKDDGNGLPDDFDAENSTTLGMQLIRTLSEQLEADYEYQSEGEGCIFSLEFEKLSRENEREISFGE
jgi:PAS domain S-box-containing protein